MAVIKAQVIIECSSGEPKDTATNTLYFNTPDLGGTSTTAVLAGLEAFYEEVPLSTKCNVARTIKAKLYDATLAPPSYPIIESSWTRSAALTSPEEPTQLTAVLSFFNTTESTIPRARRRGRIYLPFLPETACTGGFLTATYKTAVFLGLTEMDTALASDGVHCIWSGTRGALSFIDEYRMDNSPDIQRRRKQLATVTWTQAGP